MILRGLAAVLATGLLLVLSACPSTTSSTRENTFSGSRFAVESVGSCVVVPQSKQGQVVGALCGTEGKGCRLFHDKSTHLLFCMPAQTEMQRLQFAPGEDPMSFEIRLLVKEYGIVVYVRKDPLPAELPEGALAGSWLLRYLETYIQKRGAELREVKRRILSRKRSRFLHATAAVWAAFPFAYGGREYWEEILVLAREPGTRYLISIRMAESLRSQNPQRLRQFLMLFLHQLRLGSQPPKT